MFKRLLKKIARVLNDAQIPYMIIGGQAVLVYGEPRLTKDIDVTLGAGTDQLETVKLLVLRNDLKILVDDVDNFVRKTMVLPVLDEGSGIRIDLIFSFSLYEKQAIDRARDIVMDDVAVKFASLEDLVIHKVIAGRARDIEDIKSILLKNTDYNAKYIMKWLGEFDISLASDYSAVFTEIKKSLE